MSQIRNVAKTDSRSMFHVPASPSTRKHSTAGSAAPPSSTQQFGVSLSTLEERGNGELPLVIRACTEYLEKEGLEVMGIFRRAPNNVKVRAIKKRFDLGECGVAAEFGSTMEPLNKGHLEITVLVYCPL